MPQGDPAEQAASLKHPSEPGDLGRAGIEDVRVDLRAERIVGFRALDIAVIDARVRVTGV